MSSSDAGGNGKPISFSLEGDKLEGREGDTVASALLRNHVTTFTRSIKYHRPRGPFCFAGSCGQCLIRVDGVPSLPACRVELKPGMACERQNAPLGLIDQDLFRAVDFIYPGGLDHHHLMIQSRLLGRVALEVARRLAGLGTLPDKTELPQPGSAREVPLVIVGGGSAGLAAARGAVSGGAQPLVLESEDSPGGSGRLWDHDAESPAELGDRERMRAALEATGIELQLGSEVVGLYADPQNESPALLAVRQGQRLAAVRARRVILATGGSSQPLPFAGNDRPGVYAARGLLELHRRSGVRVGEGEPLALVGSGSELLRCAQALVARGYELAAMVALDAHPIPQGLIPTGVELIRGEVMRARGRPVAELQVKLEANGKTRKIRCGAVAIALPPAPLFDLAGSVGARAELSADQSGFPLVIDESGRTSLPWLFACGTVAGRSSAPQAPSDVFAEAVGASAAREAIPPQP